MTGTFGASPGPHPPGRDRARRRDGEPYSLVSHRLGAASCWAIVASGPGGQPDNCGLAVVMTGLVRYVRRLDAREGRGGSRVEVWQVFACVRHGEELVGARELLARDRDLARARAAEAARWRPGVDHRVAELGPWRPPTPLAIGPDADIVLERARRWSARSETRGAARPAPPDGDR